MNGCLADQVSDTHMLVVHQMHQCNALFYHTVSVNIYIILYSQSGIEHVHVQYKTYKEKKIIKKYTNN